MGRRTATEGEISTRKAAEAAVRQWAAQRGGDYRYRPALIQCGPLGFLHVRWKRDATQDEGGFYKLTWHDGATQLEYITS